MKKSVFVFTLIVMTTVSWAQSSEDIGDALSEVGGPVAVNSNVYVYGGSGVELYNNGPLVNSPGTGAGGDDESVLQSNTLGHTLIGYGHQVINDNRVADDFSVTGNGWEIESIDFFAYQTNETASTITAINLQIWDGVPGEPGSNVVFGDTVTNIMTSTAYSGIQRVTETTLGATNRQVAVSNVAVGITLSPGTYWLDWQADGSGASGPWAPPITINGQLTTGNALQSLAGAAFVPLVDTGTSSQQGLPFVIYGQTAEPTVVPSLNFYGLIVLGMMSLIFTRRFIKK